MNENTEPPMESSSSGMNRRKFISAVGAAAVTSAAFLHEMGQAQNGTPLYQDSFGNIAPVSPSLIALGITPPPIPSLNQQGAPDVAHRGHALASHRHGYVPKAGPETTPGPPAGYTSPNILLVMVDQLRAPRWLPPGGQTAVDNLLTNITALRNQSLIFPNYYVAATACSPSRATLLTGLYTQQTCFFETQGDSTACQPNLQEGFPNIATVLSQTAPSGPDLGYNCTWIGKWHLSDPVQGGVAPGDNGPSDYGFVASTVAPNLPPNNSLPSPNVGGNLANLGYNPNQTKTPAWLPMHGPLPNACATGGTGCSATTPTCTCVQTAQQYNDAAICDWFLTTWINNIPAAPWFVAVSFVNPHDITQFPFSFNLAGTTGFGTTQPSNFPGYLFFPPLVSGSTGVVGSGGPIEYADTFLPTLANATLYPTTGAGPTGWNYQDDPSTQLYSSGVGKPDLQAIYQTSISNRYGTANDTVSSWSTFLNYYLWMQSCVDVQVGRVLSAVSALAEQPIIIFLSDHGEYGGSHNLHAKGGALYDEAINVPLYISFPSMRGSTPTSATIKFACSSVDILPLLYALGLGSDYYWRHSGSDIINYLLNRESIFDAIMNYAPGTENTTANQRRLSGIGNSGGAMSQAGQSNQPYILHTTDEFGNIPAGVATHAIAFRTIDLTVVNTTVENPANGGAKLGIYSQWPTPNPHNTSPTQTKPLAGGQQFEFYDYTGTMNFGETGNEYTTNAKVATYVTQFKSAAVQAELYLTLPSALQPTYVAALTGYQNGQTIPACMTSNVSPTPDA